MTSYDKLREQLVAAPKKWLVTGVSGFIGSNLLETLLSLNQQVVGLDNFATGRRPNIEQVKNLVSPKQWENFQFVEGSISDAGTCHRACEGVDFVLHQAALGSVPRSIVEPLASHEANVTGFLNMLVAVRDQKVRRMVYASSSAIY